MMQRMVSATNKCSHRGFPQIHAYLQGRPTHYVSHEFVEVAFHHTFSKFYATVTGAWVSCPRVGGLAEHVARTAVAEPLSIQTKSGSTHSSHDYLWRPDVMGNFPWFFFYAATDVSWNLKDGLWLWHEEKEGTTTLRHPCYEARRGSEYYTVRSHRVKETGGGRGMKAMLERGTGKAILRYDHYRELRLDRPWRIPLLRGKMPACPNENSSAEDKGQYALFVMFLFRPWRHPSSAVKMWLEKGQCLRLAEGPYSSDTVWTSLYEEYLRWYTVDVETIATPYFRCEGETLPAPLFDTKDLDMHRCRNFIFRKY